MRRLITGIAATSFGDGLVSVAFPLLAVHLTTQPVLVAGVSIAASLPWLLISLPAGAFADRVDRRRVALGVDLARAAVIGGLGVAVALHHATIALVYLVSFAVAAGETAIYAATRAILPLLSDGEDLIRANGRMNAAQISGTDFTGPALGGVLYSVAASIPFIGDAVTYALSAVFFRAAMPASSGPRRQSDTTLRGDIAVGLRFFLASKPLKIIAAVVSGFALCRAMIASVLVLYATRILHLDGIGFGLLLTVAAIGSTAAGLLAGRVRAALGSVATVLIAGMFASLGYLLLAATRNLAVAMIALTLESAGIGMGNVATFSLRQALIPLERFGLVNNAFRMCIYAVVPIGALSSGVLTTHFGTRTTFWIAGVLQMILLVAFALPLRSSTPEAPVGSHSRPRVKFETPPAEPDLDTLDSAN